MTSDLHHSLTNIIGKANWFADNEKINPYLTPSTSASPTGKTGGVATPSSVAEIQSLVRHCHKNNIPITPQGGNTGRCEGATPNDTNGIILSLEKLNTIRAIDPEGQTATVDAGVVLDILNNNLAPHNLRFPIALGASGSCQIGGNIATNAGGIGALKYGTTRHSVLGLEAVLADGTLYSHLSPLVKDNRGYHIDGLLIGSEGTLAIITGATLKLVPKPQHNATYFVAGNHFEDLLEVFLQVRKQTDNHLAAAEIISQNAIEQLFKVYPDTPFPFSKDISPKNKLWFLLLEWECTSEAISQALTSTLQTILMDAYEQEKASDIAIAQNQREQQEFWQIRELIVSAPKYLDHRHYTRFDIAVPLQHVPTLMTRLENGLARFDENIQSFPYGHLGDGNLHYNFYSEDDLTDSAITCYNEQLRGFVYEEVLRLGGTFSAEHGIGKTKVGALRAFTDPHHLAKMSELKQAFDPKGILNPGTILASSTPTPHAHLARPPCTPTHITLPTC